MTTLVPPASQGSDLPYVSIIIPCYNVAQYIEECVSSCYAQTYSELEVICIDNNSSDDTLKLLKNLRQRYPKIVIDQELNPGAPAARNKGLSLAKGEWIQFLDADDLLLPEKLTHQVALIDKKTSFIAGACIRQDVKEEQTECLLGGADIYKALFTAQLGITSSNLWRKSAIEAIGGWDESLKSSQEAELMFRLVKKDAQVLFDNQPLTIIRERESGQISQRNPGVKWQLFYEIRQRMANWLKENRSEYYQQNKAYFDDTLFGILRILAEYDLATADKLQKQTLKNYRPSRQQTHSTRSHVWLYRLFGFRGAERIRMLLNVIRGAGEAEKTGSKL